MKNIYFCDTETIAGQLLLFATDEGLCYIQYGSMDEHRQRLLHWFKKKIGDVRLQHQPDHFILKEAKHQLTRYFSGASKRFDLPLELIGTPFQKKVWDELTRIEYGQTKSYKQIAEAIGSPRAVRAVGMANNRNPISIIIPCHRVIGHDGRLVGYGGGLNIKETLLALEKENAQRNFASGE